MKTAGAASPLQPRPAVSQRLPPYHAGAVGGM